MNRIQNEHLSKVLFKSLINKQDSIVTSKKKKRMQQRNMQVHLENQVKLNVLNIGKVGRELHRAIPYIPPIANCMAMIRITCTTTRIVGAEGDFTTKPRLALSCDFPASGSLARNVPLC